MRLWSNDFREGSAVPDKCAYRRGNLSPHLAWSDVPKEAKSIALICSDPDAPGGNWIHWLIHDIPVAVTTIPAGGPVPGVQSKNDFGDASWGGPAPPSGTHRYVFTLYALSVEHLTSVNKGNFKGLCESKKIASTKLIGTYTRK